MLTSVSVYLALLKHRLFKRPPMGNYSANSNAEKLLVS